MPEFALLAKEKDNEFESIKKVTEFTAQRIEDKIQGSKERTSEQVDELFNKYISKKPDGSYRSSLDESKGRYQMAAFFNNKSEPDIRYKGIFVDAFLFFDPFAESLLPFVFTTYFASNNSIWQYGFPDWALTSNADEYFDKYGWFYEANPAHNPYKGHKWTDMYYDELQGQWEISSLMPIYDGEEFLGIVGQDFILKKIIETTNRSTIGKSGILFFIDNLNNIVAHPDTMYVISKRATNDERLDLKSLSDEPLTKVLQGIQTDKQGFMFTEESDRRIVIYFPLKSINWKMVYSIKEDELLKLVDQTIKEYLFSFIFFSLLIIALIILLIKFMVTSPIKELTKIANEISKGNLDMELDIKSQDEIGELASSFKKMTRDLKKSKKDLEEENKKLEKKVRERTKELEQKNKELEGFNKFAIERELKMIELKKKIKGPDKREG